MYASVRDKSDLLRLIRCTCTCSIIILMEIFCRI